MKELHILLTPNEEHKKVFPNMPVVGLWNGKSLNDYLVRVKLLKLEESRRCEPCGKKTSLVYNSISTTTTFATEGWKVKFRTSRNKKETFWDRFNNHQSR